MPWSIIDGANERALIGLGSAVPKNNDLVGPDFVDVHNFDYAPIQMADYSNIYTKGVLGTIIADYFKPER